MDKEMMRLQPSEAPRSPSSSHRSLPIPLRGTGVIKYLAVPGFCLVMLAIFGFCFWIALAH
jgi:hypothetical protein